MLHIIIPETLATGNIYAASVIIGNTLIFLIFVILGTVVLIEVRDVCNSKISFIHSTCQAAPTINKEACDPNNHFINNYLKYFNPSILTDISSKEAYVTLNTALQIPVPSEK